MKVSYDVVIVNFNGEKIIGSCLESLYTSKAKPAKIIVFDNDSRDGSVELIKKSYPQVELIESEINIGFGRANNKAAKRSTAPYILFLNNDIKLERYCTSKLIRAFDDPSVAVVNPIICKGWQIKKNIPPYAFGAVLDKNGFNYGLYDLSGDKNDLNCFSGAGV